MIQLERPSAPKAFLKQAATEFRAAERFYLLPVNTRSQRRFNFEAYTHRSVLDALSGMTLSKCSFCESPFQEDSIRSIDHYRPKWGTIGEKEKVIPDLYWWLGSSWDNLFVVCLDCGRHRGTRFPLSDETKRAAAPGEESHEYPLLINPCLEDPAKYLVFTEQGTVVARVMSDGKASKKGLATIEIFGLNRPSLLEWRRERAENLSRLIRQWDGEISMAQDSGKGKEQRLKRLGRKVRDEIGNFLSPEFPFVAVGRQIAHRWIKSLDEAVRPLLFPERNMDWWIRQALRPGEFVSLSAQKKAIEHHQISRVSFGGSRQSLWISRIEIENFKAIEHLDLSIPEPTHGSSQWPWLVILGENSTAKSTVLEAIALTLAGPAYARNFGLDPKQFLRRLPEKHQIRTMKPPETGRIRISFTGDAHPVEMTFQRRSAETKYSRDQSPLLLLGYGATRLLPRAGHHPEEEHGWPTRARNLFDPFLPLRSPHWLLNQKDVSIPEFGNVAIALRHLLPNVSENWLDRDKKSLYAILNNTRFSLFELSAGYQTVVALALDIYRGLRRYFKAMELAEGVVLLDEIGEHLHPQWKKRIVSDLRRVFPRVQFITTTHDPLCLRGLHENEVVLMRRSADGSVFRVRDLPPVDGMRVDQILMSEHFGLGSVYDDDTEKLFSEYYALLAKPRLSAEESKKLKDLKAGVDKREVLARNRRERLFLDAIDRFLARELHAKSDTEKKELEKVMDAELEEIWKELDLVEISER